MQQLCVRYIEKTVQCLMTIGLLVRHSFYSFKRKYLYPEKWSFLFSNKDFVLRIAAIPKDQSHQIIRNFPPPGYGIPTGKKSSCKQQPSNTYALFLYPAGIALQFIIVCTAIYSFILPGLIMWLYKAFVLCEENKPKSGGVTSSYDLSQVDYVIMFIMGFIFLLFLLLVTYQLTISLLFKRKIRPVFSEVWKLWPESQYDLFLTVPHLVKVSRADREMPVHKYWQPDEATPIAHQSSEYSQGMNTVQEVLLNLAIFELFFYNDDENDHDEKNDKESGEHSIKLNNWLIYYFSPIWISYFIILLMLFMYQVPFIAEALYTDFLLFAFPANIIAASLIWLFISVWFVWKRIDYLRSLHKDVKDGVYQSHLDLVPPKILKSITRIPHEQQILAGIRHLQRVLNIIQIVAFSNILLILEVLTAYSPKN